MKVKVSYYVQVEKEYEMTPEEYCKFFHAYGTLNGKKVVPDGAIKEEIILDKDARIELNNYLFRER